VAQVLSGAEARAAVVMADASNMRLYEVGAALASAASVATGRNDGSG
jgi:hypothetical protein